MNPTQRVTLAVVATVALAIGGCASRSSTTHPSEPRFATVLSPDARMLVYRTVTPEDLPADPEASIMVHLDLYDIQVPIGAISRSAEFAALVDPGAVPAAGRDTLARNGVRVGLGSRAQWDEFRRILEAYPAMTTPSRVMGTTGRAEVMIRREVVSQTLFYTDSVGELVGRTYDLSDNFWALRFNPVPHRPGWTSLSLCPVVRASRRRLEYTRTNHEAQITFTQPETLYDLSMTADVPVDKFLVIWPIPDVQRQTTLLGNAFLLSGDYPKQMEHVMILSPAVFQFDEKATRKLKPQK